jgi:Fe-S-cluster containining protein
LKEKAAAGRFLPSDAQAAEIFTYLGKSVESPVPEIVSRTSGESLHWYTCTKLQPNGDCGIYETRPLLCREFPYNNPCPYKACEWEPETRPDVRADRIVPLRMMKKYKIEPADLLAALDLVEESKS